MNAADLLAALGSMGVRVESSGTRIRARIPRGLNSSTVRALLVQKREDILALLNGGRVEPTSPSIARASGSEAPLSDHAVPNSLPRAAGDLTEEFEERAAILQFDARHARLAAEHAAREMLGIGDPPVPPEGGGATGQRESGASLLKDGRAAREVSTPAIGSPPLRETSPRPRASGSRGGIAADAEGIARLAERLASSQLFAISLDLGGHFVHGARPRGIAFALRAGEAHFVPIGPPASGGEFAGTLAPLKEILENPLIEKVVHDAKPITHALREIGVRLRGVSFDTALASRLADAEVLKLDLASVADRHLAFRDRRRAPYSSGNAEADRHCRAAELTLRLVEPLQARLEARGLASLFHETEMPLVEILVDIERTGIRVDVDWLQALDSDLREKGNEKFSKNFVAPLLAGADRRTSRVHARFDHVTSRTGRIYASHPNLQGVPKRSAEGLELRRAFRPSEPGWLFLSADYNQIDLRVLAHLSGDEELCRAFRDGVDVHRRTAALIFRVSEEDVSPGQRSLAKEVNFGIVFGMGAAALARRIDATLEYARTVMAAWNRAYRGVCAWQRAALAQAEADGFVATLFGRRRLLPNLASPDRNLRAEAERMVLNTPVQGTTAEILKRAMIGVYGRFHRDGLRARLLLPIHDELLVELPEEDLPLVDRVVREEMENSTRLVVPLRVEVRTGRSWGDLE